MSVATLHADVRAAFRARLQTVAGLPAQLAWEGREFAPTRGTPWARESVRSVSSQVRGVGSGAVIDHRLAGAVTLFWPAGSPLNQIEGAAGALMASLLPGLVLTAGANRATVMQCERSSLVQEPDWISCTVTATLTAYTVG